MGFTLTSWNILPIPSSALAILSKIGNLSMTKSSSSSWHSTRFWAWPRMPNPVTSVAACAFIFWWYHKIKMLTLYFLIRVEASLFKVIIETVAASYPFRISSSFIPVGFILSMSWSSSHWFKLTAICVPKGFVNTRTSPALAPFGRTNSFLGRT